MQTILQGYLKAVEEDEGSGAMGDAARIFHDIEELTLEVDNMSEEQFGRIRDFLRYASIEEAKPQSIEVGPQFLREVPIGVRSIVTRRW